MKVHLENKLNDDELRELRVDLDNLKEPDPKNINKVMISIYYFLGRTYRCG
jgi:hypothetical protein